MSAMVARLLLGPAGPWCLRLAVALGVLVWAPGAFG
jgi:hypothetical protein